MADTFKEFQTEQTQPTQSTQEETKETQEQKTEETQQTQQTQTTQTPEGKEGVKENVVVIDGKERPLKNYEAELKRKHQEDIDNVRSEYEQRTATQQTQQSQQANWYDQIEQKAVTEMSMTGKSFPWQTVMDVSHALSQRNLDTTMKTRDEAAKTVRSFRRVAHKDPDFAEVEDEFENLVDQLPYHQVNHATLEVILNSVTGKRAKELVKKARTEGKKQAEKETEILGSPTTSVEGTGTPAKTSLSSAQQSDLDRMNSETNMDWTPEEYLKRLREKQERFKVLEAKNIPQTLNDMLIK